MSGKDASRRLGGDKENEQDTDEDRQKETMTGGEVSGREGRGTRVGEKAREGRGFKRSRSGGRKDGVRKD